MTVCLTDMNSDAVTGAFAGFELNAKIKQLHFKDIRLTVDKQRWPAGVSGVRRAEVLPP